ncbi:MAG: hypothetical protein IJO40_02895, partial [Thermoguttaceae bacterium]|nr:hypothetical protein [Thermoguttaceae bacterium]
MRTNIYIRFSDAATLFPRRLPRFFIFSIFPKGAAPMQYRFEDLVELVELNPQFFQVSSDRDGI